MINQHNSLIGFLVYDAQRAIAKSLETALKPYEITPGPGGACGATDTSATAARMRSR